MLTLGLGSSSVLSLGLLKCDSQVTFDLDGHYYIDVRKISFGYATAVFYSHG